MVARNYFLVRVNSHSGNDQKTATFEVGINEKFTATAISIKATSTNAYITEIKDSAGIPYGALSNENRLYIDIFSPSTSKTDVPTKLAEPIVLTGGNKLFITTVDASGTANTIYITLHGKMETA